MAAASREAEGLVRARVADEGVLEYVIRYFRSQRRSSIVWYVTKRGASERTISLL